ncbi:hypothetical protein ACOSP7_022606 [Xanthoceras sorbifolium]
MIRNNNNGAPRCCGHWWEVSNFEMGKCYEGCGNTFIDAGALRKHSHIHGERQYICHYKGCGKVLLPCCIDNYHEILCKINLRKKVIAIYDSLQKYKDPKYRISQIQPLIKNLPSMLRCGGLFENTGIALWTDGIKVNVLPPDKLPQQPDGTSCGAFVTKYLENIMTFKEFNWNFGHKDVKKNSGGDCYRNICI